MSTGAAEAGVWLGTVWAWKNQKRLSLGLTTFSPTTSSHSRHTPSPRKPRRQRQENRAVPATTELWQTPRPAQGPEWQGSSSWHRSPTHPGRHLWEDVWSGWYKAWHCQTDNTRCVHQTTPQSHKLSDTSIYSSLLAFFKGRVSLHIPG